MKRLSILLAALIIFSLTFVPYGTASYAAGNDIVAEINEENFPDPEFRSFLLNGSHMVWDDSLNPTEIVYDSNKDGYLSEDEINQLKQLLIAQMPIQDLTGIEYLTALIEIQCQYTAVKSLDLSNNKGLLYLNSYHCMLEGDLDLSENTKLQGIATHNNRGLTSINITNCPDLDSLNIDNTSITELDLSGNPKLRALSCAATPISKLDISNNPGLTLISAYNSNISEINFGNTTALESLDLADNKLQSLDVSKNTGLVDLNITGNPLVWLNVGDNHKLTVFIDDTEITMEVTEKTFDITEKFPGIDPDKVTVVSGAVRNGNFLSGYSLDKPIIYKYDCGKTKNGPLDLTVTINLTGSIPAGDNDNSGSNPNVPDNHDKNNNPATEDKSSMNLWFVILLASGFTAAIASKRKYQ